MADKANAPNWKKIKAEYLRGDVSQRKLALKYGVSFGTLRRKANLEKWASLRTEAETKAEQKLVQKSADYRAEMAETFELAGLEAIKAIYDGFRRFPNGTGTKITRYVKGKKDEEHGGKPSSDANVEHDLKANMDMLATWAKVYGMDAATRLREKELQSMNNPFSNDTMGDDGFLDALTACSDAWQIDDEPANIDDGGGSA